jgi:hypothetical protein
MCIEKDVHDIIQTHNNVLQDWQYFVGHSSYLVWMWGIFVRTGIILQNIPHIQSECENIVQNIVRPIEHCYDSE